MGIGLWMVSFLSFKMCFEALRMYLMNFMFEFVTVFYVTDQNGNKLAEENVAEKIQQVGLKMRYDLGSEL